MRGGWLFLFTLLSQRSPLGVLTRRSSSFVVASFCIFPYSLSSRRKILDQSPRRPRWVGILLQCFTCCLGLCVFCSPSFRKYSVWGPWVKLWVYQTSRPFQAGLCPGMPELSRFRHISDRQLTPIANPRKTPFPAPPCSLDPHSLFSHISILRPFCLLKSLSL